MMDGYLQSGQPQESNRKRGFCKILQTLLSLFYLFHNIKDCVSSLKNFSNHPTLIEQQKRIIRVKILTK